MAGQGSTVLRMATIAALGAALITSASPPASAQIREQIKNKMVDSAANSLVSQIQTDSCVEFEAMLKNKKGGASDSKSGMMKKDPAMRARFVNRVAGPLVNKMIDCDLLPGK